MRRTVSYHILVVIPLFAVIASCAKVSSPAGGPKDTDPPVVVKSEPASGTTNFSANRISITFDEFVTLDKVNEKFMVSPPLEKRPVITLKGKSVVVEFDEKLRDSTTYTFYFQDAIRDLNEANPIDNFQFVFSTGDALDSLSVTGNVLSSFSLDPPENTLVLLYRDHSDSAFMKRLPDYITRVTPTGYFRFDNVKEGVYRLFALRDADNSKNFNIPDEEIAFSDSLVSVTIERNYIPKPAADSLNKGPSALKVADTTVIRGEHKLFLFKPLKKTRYLTSSARAMKYKLIFTLSVPPDTLGFDFSIPGTHSGAWFMEKSRKRDTLTVWLTDSTVYSSAQLKVLAAYPFTDSLGNTVRKQDTVLLRYLEPRAPRGRQGSVPLKVTSSLSTGSLRPSQNIFFNAETPFRQPDTARISLFEVNGEDRLRVPYTIEKDPDNACRLRLITELQQSKRYLFIADSAAFGNIYGEVTDSTGSGFSVRNDETFGRLILNINNFEGKRIVHLLSNQDKVLREITRDNDGEVEFMYIDKGTYRLRVIYDLNGDGEWTTGDFHNKIQPEPVSFYPREIPVGENHWVNQDWDIGTRNIKTLKSVTGTKPGR
ncbi:MAG TPA: Ig-like domain-containing domain [Bacteroidales bacterium]|nr:Ig-like domain-containing domain [Bacteroidales bacterium]HPF03408.1 Ig-like domain-containing domain [Bacteroidales bacterium]HPJ60006.1 Ig-like domain-containing domain [Bacteroidales bacterium]HPR12929.1 Ig-like domain-containing domain [Bacteroidales bacterium]HRW86354.1 Ig-like domain-containing domain [Bacteroidales bacterium]